jgi:hypothetical protein
MIINFTMDTGESASPVTSGSANGTAKDMELLWRSFGDGTPPSGQARSAVSFDSVGRAYASVIMAASTGSTTFGAGGYQVGMTITGSNKAQAWADNLTSLINTATGSAGAGFPSLLTAQSAASGTLANWQVKVTAVEAGSTANFVALAVSGTNTTLSSTTLLSGSAGAPVVQYF